MPTANGDRNTSVFKIERCIWIAGSVTLAAIAIAAHRVDKILAAVAAAVFAFVIIWIGHKATAARAPSQILHHTTRLTAITMAWAGTALLIAYPIVGLKWLHGWEYGLGALLLAAGFAHFAKRFASGTDALSQPQAVETLRKLAMLESAVIVATLAWLIFSGKLATPKGDWLANDVFLAMACTILTLSIVFIARARSKTN